MKVLEDILEDSICYDCKYLEKGYCRVKEQYILSVVNVCFYLETLFSPIEWYENIFTFETKQYRKLN